VWKERRTKKRQKARRRGKETGKMRKTTMRKKKQGRVFVGRRKRSSEKEQKGVMMRWKERERNARK
jgi:hypothetical protein